MRNWYRVSTFMDKLCNKLSAKQMQIGSVGQNCAILEIDRSSNTARHEINMTIEKIVAVPLSAFGVALEPLEEHHRAGLAAAGSDPLIWRFLPYDVSSGGMDRWFDSTLALQQKHREAIWAVRRTDNNTVVGTTRYLNIAAHDLRVEIGGTWYARDVWAGIVNPACKFMLLSHGFETLRLNRIELKTDARNERSQSAIARLGAVREGVFRRHMVLPDGHIRDTVYYSVIREEWPAVRDGLVARLTGLEQLAPPLA